MGCGVLLKATVALKVEEEMGLGAKGWKSLWPRPFQ